MPTSNHLLTLSTHRRRFVLRGDSRDIASRALADLPRRWPGLDVDCAVFMPDRLFAIVRLPNPTALGSLVQTYKAETTRSIRTKVAIDRVWQKGYEHRVIRDEAELIAVRAQLRSYERAT
ncbi:MAG TPA: transposase [Vicinamibacterales bacterium]|nr:transposase [Vicinamibacterales bacterium]